MNVRTSHRAAAGVAPLIAAGLLLSACGGSGGDEATRPTITLEAGATSYATLPVATTVPETEATDESEETSGTQEYTVQAGDYGIKVADQFGVSLEDLENVNGWSDASREFPGPGTVIKIPPGGTVQASTGDEDTGDTGDNGDGGETTADTTDTGETGETIPEVGGNCEAGSYVIEAGDTSRVRVAEKFDVTVEELDAANAGTDGYSAFYPGLTIIIPAKDDC